MESNDSGNTSTGDQQTSAGGASTGGSSSGVTGGTAGEGSGNSGSGAGDGSAGSTSTIGAVGIGSSPAKPAVPAEQRQRPADLGSTAGGASTVAGDEHIDRPTDTGAANDPNSSHPATGEEGGYAEKMTGKAQD